MIPGSLYDIIENEDIKLDNLFIASLIYDLIKVRIKKIFYQASCSSILNVKNPTGNDLHTFVKLGVSW